MSSVTLIAWVFGAFVGLALAGYAVAEAIKPLIKAVWVQVGSMEEGTVSRMLYRGAIRAIPINVGLLVGGARWAVALLHGPEAAEHFRWWPPGLTPMAGPVLGLASGGLAIRIHNAVGNSLADGFRGLWTAVATRIGGQPPARPLQAGEWHPDDVQPASTLSTERIETLADEPPGSDR